MGSGRSVGILLVEDNPGDARLVEVALKDGRLPNRIHHVVDGVEALAFLRREGRYADAPKPDIVLLDLNMPRMDGRQFLAEVKSIPDLRKIPVVALTTSSDEMDVDQCYEIGANAFITKPVDFEKFVATLRQFQDFWFSAATLPDGLPKDE